MYIDVKTLKNDLYRDFISQYLKNTQCVIISMINSDLPAFAWKSIPIPEKTNFHSIVLSDNEQLYCFENNYYDICSTLNLYSSMEEFFNFTNIYRLMFVLHNKVVIECMHDEIIMYDIQIYCFINNKQLSFMVSIYNCHRDYY